MCPSSKPKVTKAPDPVVTPAAPPPEPTAEAPTPANEGAKRTTERETKRRGTSSLRIDLNLGSGAGLGSNGLTIPK